MIDEISVENLALIKQATFMPSAGLTVLTGETGAGKTALVSAVELLCGARASKDSVREGQNSLRVEGRLVFRVRPTGFGSAKAGTADTVDSAGAADAVGAAQFADTADAVGAAELADVAGTADTAGTCEKSASEKGADSAPSDNTLGDLEDEIIISRSVDAQGRSRAKINGHMAAIKELAACVPSHIDLCGQHEHQALLDVANHAKILDAWIGERASAALNEYRQAFIEREEAARELECVRDAASASGAKLDEARFVVRCIDEVSPKQGELEELQDSLSRAEHAESLARSSHGAYASLTGGTGAGGGAGGSIGTGSGSYGGDEMSFSTNEQGAIDLLNQAADYLEDASQYDEVLHSHAQTIRETTYVLEDVSRDVRAYRDAIDFSADVLAQQQERMSALTNITRQFGPRMEDVFLAREEANKLISAVDNSAALLQEASEKLNAAEDKLCKCAEALLHVRQDSAPKFAKLVSDQMARLHMGTAALECKVASLKRDEWTISGPASVEFCFAPGAGMNARPLVRIASGGELSRVLLAIKVVMGSTDNVDTLIFDEVDAGCGGKTALALAEVLCDLARTHQVIVITHLAQVAVCANTHYVVSKTETNTPETKIEKVSGEDRTREIARMLSGSVSNASLAHAKEMLAEHASPKSD